LGVSVLERAGFRDARNLLGGMTAWKALELPIE
jgi:hydroxyacylglutathione hydrolase